MPHPERSTPLHALITMAENALRSFDKYDIIRRLAMGGMGEIFLARQRGIAGFERLAIIKTLLPGLGDDDSFLSQFLDEARVAATLNHPNIVAIYEVGQSDDVYFIAMEYIIGGDLMALIRGAQKQQATIPHRVCAAIIRAAALGLDHAHHAVDANGRALNIVHRDVSPHNIMVRGDGVVKVVDFGVARASNRATRTTNNVVKGKLAYMAPEQFLGEPLDGRADQFGLGVVLWELLTRRRLFQGDTPLEVGRKILHEPVLPPSAHDPSIPAALEAVVMRMLSRHRQERFARCGDTANALQAYLDASGGSADRETAEVARTLLSDQLAAHQVDLASPSSSSSSHAAGAGSAVRCSICGTPQRGRPRFCADCGARMAGGEHTPPPSPPEVSTNELEVVPLDLESSLVISSVATEVPTGELPVISLEPMAPVTTPPPVMTARPRESAPPPPSAPSRSSRQRELEFNDDGTVSEVEDMEVQHGVLADFLVSHQEKVELAMEARKPRNQLVARAAELQVLRTALTSAVGGSLSGVLVLGEPGVGKTRLVEEADGLAQSLEMSVVRVRGRRYSVPCSHDVFRQVFLGLSDLLSPNPLEDADHGRMGSRNRFEHLQELPIPAAVRQRMQRLLDGAATIPDGLDPDEHLQEGEAALLSALTLASQHRPICIIVDDVQHADPGSLALLQMLVARCPRARICLLLTAPQDLNRIPAQLPRLPLRQLTADECVQVAEQALDGTPLPPAVVAVIRQRSHGNPLVARSQVLQLFKSHALQQYDGFWQLLDESLPAQLPDRYEAMAQQQLSTLSLEAALVLQLAAVMGEVFSLDVLERAAGFRAHRQAMESVEAGFIKFLGRSNVTMEFRHGVIRDLVLAPLSTSELRALRVQVATAMERDASSTTGEVLEVMARLFLMGEANEKAAYYSGMAAERLVVQGNLTGAADLYRRALNLTLKQVVQSGPANALGASDLFKLAARATAAIMHVDALEAAQIALPILQKISSRLAPVDAARLWRQRGLALLKAGKLQDAEAALDQALEMFPADVEVELRAELLADNAQLMEEKRDVDGAALQLLNVFQLMGGRATGNPHFYWKRLLQLGRCHLKRRRFREATEFLLSARNQAARAHSAVGEVRALIPLAAAAEGMANPTQAAACLRDAVRIAREDALFLDQAKALLEQRRVAANVSNRAEALALAQQAMEAATVVGWQRGVTSAMAVVESMRAVG